MSDPRYTDPRNDPRFTPAAPTTTDSVGGMWGWIAGLAVVALIAFVIVAGWTSSPTNTAANAPATTSQPIGTTGSGPVRNVTPPSSTTGSGATAPRPSAPLSPPPNAGGQ